MVLEVFSNLNDSMILWFYDFGLTEHSSYAEPWIY